MNAERIRRIAEHLRQEFNPDQLDIEDQSHLHAGHAGAKEGKGHFQVTIRSAAFAGKNPLHCHRLIYAALGDMMNTDIHALSIDAAPPENSD